MIWGIGWREMIQYHIPYHKEIMINAPEVVRKMVSICTRKLGWPTIKKIQAKDISIPIIRYVAPFTLINNVAKRIANKLQNV